MDTRAKIVCGPSCASSLEQLRRTAPSLRVVSGYFDPLLASHAQRLEAERAGAEALAVIVLEPPEPILPTRARAELVAALAAVSLVLVPEGAAAPAVDARFEPVDLADRARFIAYVRERQS